MRLHLIARAAGIVVPLTAWSLLAVGFVASARIPTSCSAGSGFETIFRDGVVVLAIACGFVLGLAGLLLNRLDRDAEDWLLQATAFAASGAAPIGATILALSWVGRGLGSCPWF